MFKEHPITSTIYTPYTLPPLEPDKSLVNWLNGQGNNPCAHFSDEENQQQCACDVIEEKANGP